MPDDDVRIKVAIFFNLKLTGFRINVFLMDDPKNNKPIIAISLVTVVAGFIVMLGWVLSVPAFERIIPGFEEMRFNAALCFVLFGLALLLSQFKNSPVNTACFFLFASARAQPSGSLPFRKTFFTIKAASIKFS